MKIKDLIKLMRPHQYIKNLFIFLPLFFALKITDTALLMSALIAFIAFSLTASAIYTLNDYHDIKEDRQHPKKKSRPLASGAISKSQAIVIMDSARSSRLCTYGNTFTKSCGYSCCLCGYEYCL